MKLFKKIAGYTAGILAGIILIAGTAFIAYPAITQTVGLSVSANAQNTLWNSVKDAGVQIDAAISGLLSVGLSGFNGTNWDRLRSTVANGLQVDVTRVQGNVNVVGTASDNSANSTAKLPVLPCRANTGNPAWTEGNQAPCSVDLVGNMRVVIGGGTVAITGGSSPIEGSTTFNSSTVSAANTANTTTITGSAGTRVHVYRVSAFCSAGTATLTVADGATTIYTTPTGAIGTTENTIPFNVGLSMSSGNNGVITVTTCGAANTSTLNVEADRF